MKSQTSPQQFDAYAERYDAALHRGLAISGESKEFFAGGRVEWLQRRLEELRFAPRKVLDFGCGTGSSAGFLLELKGMERVRGVDVSERSIEVARGLAHHYGDRVEFAIVADGCRCEYDLGFCNGVFHHIAPGEREKAARYVWECLRPGGVFAFFENNPWNPGTHWVMSRIEFDRDAVMLSAREARELLASAGFKVLHTDFLFFFPRWLSGLRRFERRLAGVPLGGQYMCLARKPE